MFNNRGLTLTELIIVVAIIGILAMIAIPGYLGMQSRAARSEAFTNLESLRLLEEQFFAERAEYPPVGAAAGTTTGTCSADNDNIAAIQAVLPGFQPGTSLSFSYCLVKDKDVNGADQTPCFRARAFGDTGTRVAGETYNIDCDNNKNF